MRDEEKRASRVLRAGFWLCIFGPTPPVAR